MSSLDPNTNNNKNNKSTSDEAEKVQAPVRSSQKQKNNKGKMDKDNNQTQINQKEVAQNSPSVDLAYEDNDIDISRFKTLPMSFPQDSNNTTTTKTSPPLDEDQTNIASKPPTYPRAPRPDITSASVTVSGHVREPSSSSSISLLPVTSAINDGSSSVNTSTASLPATPLSTNPTNNNNITTTLSRSHSQDLPSMYMDNDAGKTVSAPHSPDNKHTYTHMRDKANTNGDITDNNGDNENDNIHMNTPNVNNKDNSNRAVIETHTHNLSDTLFMPPYAYPIKQTDIDKHKSKSDNTKDQYKFDKTKLNQHENDGKTMSPTQLPQSLSPLIEGSPLQPPTSSVAEARGFTFTNLAQTNADVDMKAAELLNKQNNTQSPKYQRLLKKPNQPQPGRALSQSPSFKPSSSSSSLTPSQLQVTLDSQPLLQSSRDKLDTTNRKSLNALTTEFDSLTPPTFITPPPSSSLDQSPQPTSATKERAWRARREANSVYNSDNRPIRYGSLDDIPDTDDDDDDEDEYDGWSVTERRGDHDGAWDKISKAYHQAKMVAHRQIGRLRSMVQDENQVRREGGYFNACMLLGLLLILLGAYFATVVWLANKQINVEPDTLTPYTGPVTTPPPLPPFTPTGTVKVGKGFRSDVAHDLIPPLDANIPAYLREHKYGRATMNEVIGMFPFSNTLDYDICGGKGVNSVDANGNGICKYEPLMRFNSYTYSLVCPSLYSNTCSAELIGFGLQSENKLRDDDGEIRTTVEDDHFDSNLIFKSVDDDKNDKHMKNNKHLSRRVTVTSSTHPPLLHTPHEPGLPSLSPNYNNSDSWTYNSTMSLATVPVPRLSPFLAQADLFPPHFIWGVGSSAYQTEGGISLGGRTLSIWDEFAHTKGKIVNGDHGDEADNSYKLWREDLRLVKHLGTYSYRISLSWGRIMNEHGKPNMAGIRFYNQLIDAMLIQGITPLVTLYHFDLPLWLSHPTNSSMGSLYDKKGSRHEKAHSQQGWLSADIVNHFTEYARVCFESFGDRVRHWTTFNEPHTFCTLGYGDGTHAPGRCSDRSKCSSGDSATEPYVCAHNVIRAHAYVAELFNERYRDLPRHLPPGKLSFVVNSDWFFARSVSIAAIDYRDQHSTITPPTIDITKGSAEEEVAAERAQLFNVGWFLDPLYFGDYPAVMRQLVGDRLPVFTNEEKALLIQYPPDFIGVNHYTSRYISPSSHCSVSALTQGPDSHSSTNALRAGASMVIEGEVYGNQIPRDEVYYKARNYANDRLPFDRDTALKVVNEQRLNVNRMTEHDRDKSLFNHPSKGYYDDMCVAITDKDFHGMPIGASGDSKWLKSAPRGLPLLLRWVSSRYSIQHAVNKEGFEANRERLWKKQLKSLSPEELDAPESSCKETDAHKAACLMSSTLDSTIAGVRGKFKLKKLDSDRAVIHDDADIDGVVVDDGDKGSKDKKKHKSRHHHKHRHSKHKHHHKHHHKHKHHKHKHSKHKHGSKNKDQFDDVECDEYNEKPEFSLTKLERMKAFLARLPDDSDYNNNNNNNLTVPVTIDLSSPRFAHDKFDDKLTHEHIISIATEVLKEKKKIKEERPYPCSGDKSACRRKNSSLLLKQHNNHNSTADIDIKVIIDEGLTKRQQERLREMREEDEIKHNQDRKQRDKRLKSRQDKIDDKIEKHKSKLAEKRKKYEMELKEERKLNVNDTSKKACKQKDKTQHKLKKLESKEAKYAKKEAHLQSEMDHERAKEEREHHRSHLANHAKRVKYAETKKLENSRSHVNDNDDDKTHSLNDNNDNKNNNDTKHNDKSATKQAKFEANESKKARKAHKEGERAYQRCHDKAEKEAKRVSDKKTAAEEEYSRKMEREHKRGQRKYQSGHDEVVKSKEKERRRNKKLAREDRHAILKQEEKKYIENLKAQITALNIYNKETLSKDKFKSHVKLQSKLFDDKVAEYRKEMKKRHEELRREEHAEDKLEEEENRKAEEKATRVEEEEKQHRKETRRAAKIQLEKDNKTGKRLEPGTHNDDSTSSSNGVIASIGHAVGSFFHKVKSVFVSDKTASQAKVNTHDHALKGKMTKKDKRDKEKKGKDVSKDKSTDKSNHDASNAEKKKEEAAQRKAQKIERAILKKMDKEAEKNAKQAQRNANAVEKVLTKSQRKADKNNNNNNKKSKSKNSNLDNVSESRKVSKRPIATVIKHKDKDRTTVNRNCATVSYLSVSPSTPSTAVVTRREALQQRILRAKADRIRQSSLALPLVVTENGSDVPGGGAINKTLEYYLDDPYRTNYMQLYIGELARGMQQFGLNVRGYFAWSLMDNFEWDQGYSKRFGLAYVDYMSQERTPKASFYWYKSLVYLNRHGHHDASIEDVKQASKEGKCQPISFARHKALIGDV